MTKPKVLISDKMDPNAERILRERGCEVDVITGKTPEELKAIIGQYDGLAIRSATRVTREILDAATNLKVVGRAGIGVDNVDIPAASAQGVVVMNTPFGNSITTTPCALAAGIGVDNLEVGRRVEDLLGHLGRRADGEAVVLADDRLQFFGRLAGDHVDVAAALLEDALGVGVHLVGNEDFGLGHGEFLECRTDPARRAESRSAMEGGQAVGS